MVVALAAIFVVASVTPMSIFVLNLATLLGLGLGVDYSLLMTSRFREELRANVPTDRTLSRDAVRVTVATAGRAVFFSGLTVLLGLLGLVLFEFMILRSVGIAGAIVVGLAVAAALTLLPAILTRPRRADRSLSRCRQVSATPGDGRRRGPARPPGHAPSGRCPRPDPRRCSCCSGRRSSTSGSTRPTRRSCRAIVPSRAAFDRLEREFGEGEFAPIVLAIRTNRPGDAARPTSRRSTTTRVDWRPTHGSTASTASSTSTRG